MPRLIDVLTDEEREVKAEVRRLRGRSRKLLVQVRKMEFTLDAMQRSHKNVSKEVGDLYVQRRRWADHLARMKQKVVDCERKVGPLNDDPPHVLNNPLV